VTDAIYDSRGHLGELIKTLPAGGLIVGVTKKVAGTVITGRLDIVGLVESPIGLYVGHTLPVDGKLLTVYIRICHPSIKPHDGRFCHGAGTEYGLWAQRR